MSEETRTENKSCRQGGILRACPEAAESEINAIEASSEKIKSRKEFWKIGTPRCTKMDDSATCRNQAKAFPIDRRIGSRS